MSDDLPFEWDSMTGMPLLPAQTCMGGMRIVHDATGEIVREVLIFPNYVFYMTPFAGIMVGDSALCTPPQARRMIEQHIPNSVAEQAECDCAFHLDHTAYEVTPQEVS